MSTAKKTPKESTIKKWKEKFSWLEIVDSSEGTKMICNVCRSQEEKLKLMPRVNLTFVTGSTNFKYSTLNDHVVTDGHKRAVKEKENEEAIAAGLSLPRMRVIQDTPTNSAIGNAFKRMGENERSALLKLHDIAHYIAVKGHAFTDFSDQIELEKLHNVKFQAGSYENESACKDFINNISEYFFNEDLYKKLLRVNFIAILCDGTTDRSITEQEVIYIMFVDPDTMESKLIFFECLGLESSQDAGGVLDAIKAAFEQHKLSSIMDKIILLSSNGASVNSGKKSGLIALLSLFLEFLSI